MMRIFVSPYKINAIMKNNVSLIFNKYASLYQEKYMDVGLYAKSLDVFCESIKTDKTKILDIGCGPGNVIKYLLNKNPECDILGIDLADKMIDIAQTNNPTANFQTMDCRHIDQIQEDFDGIMCAFCLPYLNIKETENLIQDASILLNNDGVLYLSCMQDDYTKSGLQGPSSGGSEQMYMYYYQPQQLIELLNQYGFSIKQSFQIDNPQQSDPSIKDLVIIASIND